MDNEQTELERLCQEHNLKTICQYGQARGAHPSDYMPHNWRVTVKYKRRQFTTDFFGGANRRNISTADIVHALCAEARAGEEADELGYEDFCADMGYEAWDEKAPVAWETLRYINRRMHDLLLDDFELFASAEH